MKSMIALGLSFAVLLSPAYAAGAAPGAPAPSFVGTTSSGGPLALDSLRGKTVVLEWTNDGCPFVQKHYGAGNMQKMQAAVRDAGGVWITVISSAPGRQGHVSAQGADDLSRSRGAAPAHVVLDESGEIGRAFGAKTTPHMFVIDPEGVVRYAGAIDDQPSADPKSLDGATNYVLAAFESVVAGEPVETAQTKPYGCSIKYGS
jgi:peroxiredoxin